MKKVKFMVAAIAAIGLYMSVASTAWSYDAEMAQSYAKLFAPAEGVKVGKELHFINPEGFIKNLQAGKEYVALDVRTSGEAAMLGITMPGSMAIPLNELFKEENIQRIPTDGTGSVRFRAHQYDVPCKNVFEQARL